jgi:radical SAM protein with 4Fe4S-binding SPASM domain
MDELTLDEKMEVLRQLDEAGVAAISFSGGEPLINRDFWPVAKKAAEIGMYISIATNGTLITENIAKRLKEIGVRYVEVSLDSPYPDIHDEFRGIPGAWERAVRGIRNAKKVGLSVGIATTVTKINYKDMPEMIKLARELDVDRFIAFNFIPTGRGKEIIEMDLSPDERMELLEYFYREWMNGKLQIFSTAPMYAVVSLSHVDKGGKISPTHFAELAIPDEYMSAGFALGEFLGGCGAGRIYCSIEHNGDVYPCVFLPIKVGNVLKDGFLNIWHNSPILNQLRDRDAPEYACNTCAYRYICGGCRARAYAYYGDIRAVDPSCNFNKEHWKNLVRKFKKPIKA